MDGQNLPYRVFPEGENMFPRKGQVIGVFPPIETPFAVLLNGVSRRDKTESRQAIFPIINTKNGLGVGQGDKRM
jgi:hypothetical protein